MILTYFAFSSPFSWYFSLNLARNIIKKESTSFYWCYIFCFEYPWLFSLKILNTEGKTYSINIGEHNKKKNEGMEKFKNSRPSVQQLYQRKTLKQTYKDFFLWTPVINIVTVLFYNNRFTIHRGKLKNRTTLVKYSNWIGLK